MEYGNMIIEGEQCDYSFVKNVNFDLSTLNGPDGCFNVNEFFSVSNRNCLSKKITELLTGVDHKKRDIIIPDNTIYSVMTTVYENFIPKTSDIHSRYHPQQSEIMDHLSSLNDRVINIIVTDVKNNLGIEQINSKLTVWTTVLGDFNEYGLRQHAPIKIREKRPLSMLFQMTY